MSIKKAHFVFILTASFSLLIPSARTSPWVSQTSFMRPTRTLVERQTSQVTPIEVATYQTPFPNGCTIAVNYHGIECRLWRSCVAWEGHQYCNFFHGESQSTLQYSSCMCEMYASCYDHYVAGAWDIFDKLDAMRDWITITACPASKYPMVTINYLYGDSEVPTTKLPATCLEKCRQELIEDDPEYSQCLKHGSTIKRHNECDCSALTRRCPRSCRNSGSREYSAFSQTWYATRCANITLPLTWGWEKWPELEKNSEELSAKLSVRDDARAELELLGEAPPACAEKINESCPDVVKDVQSCWNAESPSKCFCPKLVDRWCPGVCQSGSEPIYFLRWILSDSVCRRSMGEWLGPHRGDLGPALEIPVFINAWKQYGEYRYLAEKALLPWKWTVAYNSTLDKREKKPPIPPKCPTRSSKLGAFAAINIIVLILTIIFGRRTFLHKITCGYLGQNGTAAWPLTALLSSVLFLIGNFINATIIHNQPGYSGTPKNQLMLLWCTRPRIAWFAAVFVLIEKEKSQYFSLGASALLSEAFLQIFTGIYLFRTIRFAAMNKFYENRLYDELIVFNGKSALTMYVGAVIWLIGIFWVMLNIAYAFSGVGRLVEKLSERVKRRRDETVERIADRVESEAMLQAANRTRGMFSVWKKLTVKQELQSHLPVPQQRIQEIPTETSDDDIEMQSEQNEPMRNQLLLPPVDLPPWLQGLARMGLGKESLVRMSQVVLWMIPPFIGQWLFWGGYVELYEEKYCPPKLGLLTSIWAGFSVLSVFIGSGF